MCRLSGSLTLLLIPQRYEFSSKSQHAGNKNDSDVRCCWYHKGTNFQANHNENSLKLLDLHVVADTTKVRIFKQITTVDNLEKVSRMLLLIPQRYEFSSKSQHSMVLISLFLVVADTTKVRIFKQITTYCIFWKKNYWLLLIPQRYEFSSKSQQLDDTYSQADSCCWYHKGTNFQANHNE